MHNLHDIKPALPLVRGEWGGMLHTHVLNDTCEKTRLNGPAPILMNTETFPPNLPICNTCLDHLIEYHNA